MSKVPIQSSFKPEVYNFRSLKKHKTNDESKEEIPEIDRKIICFLRQLNYSTRKIGKLMGVGSSTVSKTWKRKEETGSVKDRKRTGRPRLLLSDDEKEVFDILSSKKGLSASELHFNYTVQKNKHISKETIRNVLRNNNYTSYIKPKKPLLSKDSKAERYKFAEEHLNWTANDWKKVVFSDESKFIRFGCNHRQFYWKHPGDPFQDEYVKGMKAFGGGGVMIWGCITSQGVGHLCCIESNIDSEAYRIILAKELFGTLLQYDLSVDDIIFQQDQAPAHRSGDTKDWLYYRNLEYFDWPPYSPDLNIIEDLWSIIKQRLEKLHEREPAETLDHLWDQVRRIWGMIDINIINNLYESMPERIAAVYKQKGGYICKKMLKESKKES
ncbi:1496_t:CDS:1 [Dentiscutata heterogama]|uniref:1496_t:CDS:1 n=1 Tax=Dentiscutata heterogama TaxID=1316150 RepID=A0ACA9KVW1_9GLOM|nr:1496_t:CDS:1 [Dentiscutata heterogama]